MEKNREDIILIYSENGPSIKEVIFEVFDRYVKLTLQNTNNL